MGMFDYETDFNPAEPLWQRYSKQAEQQRQGLMRDVVDPFIEEKTGYVSPKDKLQRMAAQTDLSDMNSVRQTFSTIMSHSPTAAAKWIKSVEPVITAQQKEQELTAPKKPKLSAQAERLAIWQKDPELFKTLKEAGVFGAGGVTVNVGGEGSEYEPVDITRISSVWLDRTKSEREKLSTAAEIKGNLRKALEDKNPLAYNTVEQQYSKLVGDSRISVDEIKRLQNLGNIPDRISNFLTRQVKGTPTAKRLKEYEDVIEWLEDYNWDKLNKKRNDLMQSYKALYPNTPEGKKKQERIMQVVEPLLDIGKKPSTTGARKEKAVLKQLCTRLKTASEEGNTEIVNAISSGLKKKGITSCEGY